MKKIFFLAKLICIGLFAVSQNVIQDSIDINVLNAPSNAAFNLMGVSTSTIDRPTDLNNFRLSIQNATNSFSKFPSNYAVEFSPYAIFAKKEQSLLKFNETNFKDVFQQSLSVSFAMSKSNVDDKETNDTSSFTKLGFGFKFSILRPKWSSNTTKVINNFYTYQKDLNDAYIELANTLSKSNPKLKDIELQITSETDPAKIQELIKLQGSLREEIRDSILAALQNPNATNKPAAFKVFALAAQNLQKYTHDLKLERKGAFLDFATGIALDFPDNKFDNSLVSKAGAWLTGGYENGNSGFTFMGIGRYLFQPDKLFADDSGKLNAKNISTFDFGARALVSALDGKFTLSSEIIYRSILNDNVIKPSYRFVFNTEYDIGFNQKITFAIGRNFDGTVTKTNNLIATLNFIKGFGSNKKL